MILASAVEHRCGGVEKEIKVACVVVLIGDRYRSRFVAGIAAAGIGFGIKRVGDISIALAITQASDDHLLGYFPTPWREAEGVDAEGTFRCIKAGQFDGDGSGGLSIEEDIKRCGASLFCGEEMAVIACGACLVEGDASRSGSDG